MKYIPITLAGLIYGYISWALISYVQISLERAIQ